MTFNFVQARCCVPSCTSPEQGICKRANDTNVSEDCDKINECKKATADVCCVNSKNSSDCMAANTDGKCASGYNPISQNCKQIDSCKKSDSSASSSAPSSSTGATTTEFINPIGWKSVSELVDAVLNNLMGIIAFIAVIFIIIGGIMYMTSGGSETMITRAKKTIAGAVIGLAIAIASPTFLKEIQSILGGSNASGTAAGWVSGALTIKQIAINVLNLLLSIIGIVGIIALVIAGGMYLTAYGSEKKIDTAKKIATYAVIGIIVALASLVIIRQVDNLLRGGSASSSSSSSATSSSANDYQVGAYSETKVK